MTRMICSGKTRPRQSIFLSLLVLLFLSIPLFSQAADPHSFTGKVVGVSDGDTISIMREADLPSVIHMMVGGSGSIIPSEGQPLEVVGWYPNGTAAIGIVSYGQGRIILSNPHPNITGEWAEIWRTRGVMSDRYLKRWGWTDDMIAKGRELIKSDKDPDGPEPDWALAKAMLSNAYRKASE